MTTSHLASLTDLQLSEVDPLVVNLVVAQEIPSLAELDIVPYQLQMNALAEDFCTRYMPHWKHSYDRDPHNYRNDTRFFSVGMIAQYLQQDVGFSYIPEQKEVQQIRYLNPSDLFLNGILDSMQGTCGNIAALALALGWRLGVPVSLACVHSHYVLRHDDGDFVFNIETTAELESGFSAPDDSDLIEDYGIPSQAIECGSDLRALTPRERLGVFVWQRARHYRDLASEFSKRQWLSLAERDLMLSRHLFPSYRQTHREAAFQLALHSEERFSPTEAGHLNSYPQLPEEVRDFQQVWNRSKRMDESLENSMPEASGIQDQALDSLTDKSKRKE